ncbi:MAG TPA: MFS transporter [Steroidobacteraceae bacterium]|nr:MFS transporter [Steroidobacteraceae bacterium]
MGNPGSQPCGEAAIRSTRGASPCARSQKRWVLIAAVLASTMAFVDESVVNVALPRIQTDLGTTLAAMQWVVNAYTLCMSALLLIGGAAGDQLGRRRLFLVGVAIFAVASLGCGLAPNAQVLVVSRAVQGVGAAFLIPCSLAIIGAAFDEQERGAAIGIWSGASALAAGLGPMLGGWLVDHTSWRAIFLINPFLAVIALWIGLRHLPESRDPDAAPGLDWRGSLLVFAGLGALVYGLIEAAVLGWDNPLVFGPVIAGIVLLAAFVLEERRGRAPMMPLQLFRSLRFSGINLLTLLLYGALGGALFFLPFLLIQVHGFSATAAGAAFIPFALILGVLSRWSGQLADRVGARWPLIIGPTLVAIGFGLLARATGDPHYSAVLLPMVVLGFGMVITVTPLTTTVINAVPERQTGVASGINNAVASVASLLMIAVLGTVALSALGKSLDRQLASAPVSTAVKDVIDSARGGFVTPTMPSSLAEPERRVAHAIIGRSFVASIRLVMLIAGALALASALIAALTIRAAEPERGKSRADRH